MRFFIFILLGGWLYPNLLFAKLNVITTTTDLASIAREVGGDLVTVESLTTGNTDLHFVPAQPNFIVKVNKADVFIEVGLELEAAWSALILNQARNTKVMLGQPGYCVSSAGINILLPPQQEINRSMGDLHPQGNPHYWPDPVNGIIIARNIRDTFIRVDPPNAVVYRSNTEVFEKKVKEILRRNLERLKPYAGTKVIGYHQEFDYLINRYKMTVIDNIEEKPGVLPGPARLRAVVDIIKRNQVKLVLVSPWSNIALARRVAEESGARLVILPIQTDSATNTETYLKMIETTAIMLEEALSSTAKR